LGSISGACDEWKMAAASQPFSPEEIKNQEWIRTAPEEKTKL
jgi:hypothetical protein